MNKYVPSTGPTMQTMSFGAHRDSDRPASAVRAGASTLPTSWGKANRASAPQHQHGEPVRNIADVVMDPIRWATATPFRKGLSAAIAVLTAVIVVL